MKIRPHRSARLSPMLSLRMAATVRQEARKDREPPDPRMKEKDG